MPRFWHSARLKRLSFALSVAILISLAVGYFNDQKSASLLKRGDFPGFYVLAEIKRLGQMHEMYNPDLQREIQNRYWPSFEGGFYMSVYPAYTATLLYPLSFLLPQSAQLIFTAFMLICLLFSLKLCAALNSSLKGKVGFFVPLSLSFGPIFFGVLGAQNTALSMLLLSAVIYLLNQKTRSAEFLAGIAAGLWLFKPQFAVFLIAGFLAARLWIAICGVICIAVLFQLIAWHDSGFFWFLPWLKALSEFSERNFLANAFNNSSLIGTVRALNNAYPLIPFQSAILAAAISVLFFTIFLIFLFRAESGKSPRHFITFCALIPLLSPQTLFYDLGICFLGFLLIYDFETDRAFQKLFLIILVSILLVAARDYLSVPLFIVIPLYLLLEMREKLPLFADQSASSLEATK